MSTQNHLDDPPPPELQSSSSWLPSIPLRSTIASTLRRLSSETFSSKSDTPAHPPKQKPVRQESFGEFQGYAGEEDGSLIDIDQDGSSAAPRAQDSFSSSKPQKIPAPTNHKAAAAPLPTAAALSHTHQHLENLRRSTPSPFQPPPLTSLTLNGTTANDQILTKLLAEEIRLLMPARLQLVDSWQLLFSLARDGSSLATLYQKCNNYDGKRGGYVLVVKDSSSTIFGAYLTDPLHPSKGHYYGTGECFLWRCSVLQSFSSISLASLPPPPSADTTHATRMTTLASPPGEHLRPPGLNGVSGRVSGNNSPERIRFTAFPYSGVNDYMIFCEHGFLSVGGGDGHYGLWLDGSLEKGVSSSCPTFGNEPLSDEGTKFDVLDVEVWYIGA